MTLSRGLGFLIAHELQQFGHRAGVLQAHRGTVEAADRMVGVDAVAWSRPRGCHRRPPTSGKAVTVEAVRNFSAVLAEVAYLLDIRRSRAQPVAPKAEAALGHGKYGLADLAGAMPAAGGVVEGKVGHDAPGVPTSSP